MGREVRHVPKNWQHPVSKKSGHYVPMTPEEMRDMHGREALDHLMMYENTTEGTPISPAFKTPEELARWLADTGASAFGHLTADYDHWLAVARGADSVGAVIQGGRIESGVQARDLG